MQKTIRRKYKNADNTYIFVNSIVVVPLGAATDNFEEYDREIRIEKIADQALTTSLLRTDFKLFLVCSM